MELGNQYNVVTLSWLSCIPIMHIDNNLLCQGSLKFIGTSVTSSRFKVLKNTIVKQLQYGLQLYQLEPKHTSHENPGYLAQGDKKKI